VTITKTGYTINSGNAIAVTNSVPVITVTASASAITTATGKTTVTLGSVIAGLASTDIVVTKDGTTLPTTDYVSASLTGTAPTITFNSNAALDNTSVLTVAITKAGYIINGGTVISVKNSIPAPTTDVTSE
jgi:hypothetical protein